MNIPSNLLYTKDHEWIKIDGPYATIGITDFAQSSLGDVVYVDIEKLDEFLEAGEIFGVVEAVKTVADLYMPLTGEVIETNSALEESPQLVNSDPYGDGWIIRIKLNDNQVSKDLIDASAYSDLVSTE
ncbi:MAG: glycine cleavage system protein GcvH [Flavobacteriaceae bacterium]|nr:glycine cleavage system protein GcvH [Flavobacteriaceae bacterium]MCY4254044.1 glycine cleavage system protein GcvH [Flavobacteriaceae bacterium]